MERFARVSRTLAVLAMVFLVGSLIGRVVAFELVRGFFAEFESTVIAAEALEPEATANVVARAGIGAGLVFEIPVVIYLLASRRARAARTPRPSRRSAVAVFFSRHRPLCHQRHVRLVRRPELHAEVPHRI